MECLPKKLDVQGTHGQEEPTRVVRKSGTQHGKEQPPLQSCMHALSRIVEMRNGFYNRVYFLMMGLQQLRPTCQQGGLLRNGAYSGSVAGMQQSDDVCVVHVKAGSEYQALLYLLRSVSRHYELDDVLPEPPEDIATHRYVVLRGPRGMRLHVPR
eukprot:scaffold67710_cov20-Tisochrysis_lutea.AAC.3